MLIRGVVIELELAGIPGLIFRRRRWWRSRVALLEFHKRTVCVCVCFVCDFLGFFRVIKTAF